MEGEADREPVGWPRDSWSIQPPPAVGPISARRAYAEVLLVFAAFFAASVVVGGEALASRYPRPSGSWAIFAPATVSLLGTSVLAVLVVVLLSARRGISARSLGLCWPTAPDASLVHETWNGSGWSGWLTVPSPGSLKFGAASVSQPGLGHVDVFVIGSDSAIWHSEF